jgi:hypothetical protein
MAKLALPVSKLVRENMSELMAFAFSREPLRQLIEAGFQGEWKHLQETVFGMSELRAEKACLELAIFLRYLDDEEGLSKYVDERTNFNFGRLALRDGKEEELKLRDVANKIIHATAFQWDLSNPQRPQLVCVSRDEEKWVRAHVDIVSLAAVCGNLAG